MEGGTARGIPSFAHRAKTDKEDQNDRAAVAYMADKDSTGAHIQYNSLRACGVYDGARYFGGGSSDLEIWKNDESKDGYVPPLPRREEG